MSQYYIGTSGFVYAHWRGVFYPPDLPQSKWLDFYAHHFSTVELNNSFYRLPSEQAFISWQEKTPEKFLFSLKANRFITHIKRLKDVEEPLNNFLSRALLLKGKLGPILFQLPPNMHKKKEVLENFLKILPQGLNYVIEFRHHSWMEGEVFELLRLYNIGFCVFDMPGFTTPIIATTEFAYIRFHGSQSLYSSCYTDKELKEWAKKIKDLKAKITYIYFNNDAYGYAIQNAQTLSRLLL